MEKEIDPRGSDQKTILTYDQLTARQRLQVRVIAQALDNESSSELIKVMRKHCYFFVDINKQEGEILDYMFKG